jgi:hypothetical protein
MCPLLKFTKNAGRLHLNADPVLFVCPTCPRLLALPLHGQHGPGTGREEGHKAQLGNLISPRNWHALA